MKLDRCPAKGWPDPLAFMTSTLVGAARSPPPSSILHVPWSSLYIEPDWLDIF